MKPVGGAKISLASSPDERQKNKKNIFYIYTLLLDNFCVLIVMIRC